MRVPGKMSDRNINNKNLAQHVNDILEEPVSDRIRLYDETDVDDCEEYESFWLRFGCTPRIPTFRWWFCSSDLEHDYLSSEEEG